jgi:hypothetical protein
MWIIFELLHSIVVPFFAYGWERTNGVKFIPAGDNLYNKRQCPRQQNNQQQQLFWGRKFFRDKFLNGIFLVKSYLPKSSLAG